MSDGANTGLNNAGINEEPRRHYPNSGRPVNHVPPRTLNRRPNFINNDIGPAPRTEPRPIPPAPIHSSAQPTLQQPITPPSPVHAPRGHVQNSSITHPKLPAQNMPLSAIATQSAISSPISNDFRHEPYAKRSKSKRRFSPAQLTLVGLGCAVFAVGIITSLNTMKTNNEAQAQLKALTKNTAESKSKKATAVLGASTKSDTIAAVAPDAPKTLIIPQIQLNGIVESISLTATGSMAAPKDPKNVGWYSKSAKPGESPTVMIMNGSVGTATKPGAFALLSKLAVNATFQVIRGDGKTYNYIVVNVVSFDPASQDTAKLLVSSKPGIPTLDLVTTGSTANGNDNTQGTIVYAEQQG